MKATLRLPAIAALVLLALTGCTPTVALQPAKAATSPECANVIVHLPSTAADLPQRETNAQGTSAYGNPTRIILHCGVTVPGPTASLVCWTVNGIDWLRDDSSDPNFVFTTYGRDPAVQVVINSKASSFNTLTDIALAVGTVKSTHKCISPTDPTAPVPSSTPTNPATPTSTPSSSPSRPRPIPPRPTPSGNPTAGPVTD